MVKINISPTNLLSNGITVLVNTTDHTLAGEMVLTKLTISQSKQFPQHILTNDSAVLVTTADHIWDREDGTQETDQCSM
jgi:hypothetical protein